MKPTVNQDGIKAAELTYAIHQSAKVEHMKKIEAYRAADAVAEKRKIQALAISAVAGDAEAARDAIRTRTDAAEALDIALQVGAAMEARVTDLQTGIEAAKAAAYEGLMRHAASEAVAACNDAETALAAHAAAVDRFEAAAVTAREAERGGCKLPCDGNRLHPTLPHFTHPVHPAMRKRLRPAADVAADFGRFAA